MTSSDAPDERAQRHITGYLARHVRARELDFAAVRASLDQARLAQGEWTLSGGLAAPVAVAAATASRDRVVDLEIGVSRGTATPSQAAEAHDDHDALLEWLRGHHHRDVADAAQLPAVDGERRLRLVPPTED